MYASVCDLVCIAVLLPFVLGFCLPFFFVCLFVFFLLLKKIYFLNDYFFIFRLNNIILFYFTLFYFILFYVLLSLFFLPFTLSRVEDRLLLLQPGVRAVPLRWESQVQDTDPQETSQLHGISNGKNLPEICI